MRGGGGEQQRVAVGRRLGDCVGTHVAAGAASVLHEGAAQRGAHLLREQPRQDVGRAAGRERHDDADGLGGPDVLAARRTGQCRQQERRGGLEQ